MKGLKELNWQEGDESLRALLADSHLEKDKVLEADVGYDIKSRPRFVQVKSCFPELGESEDNMATPAIYYPYSFGYQTPIYLILESTGLIESRPEKRFYQSEWQSEISDNNIHIIETKEERFLEKEELIKLQRLNNALRALQEVCQEHSIENWDGYGAAPISHQAYSEAAKLLRMLSSFIPMPDILPEPDGGLGLEWYKEKDFSFTISVGGEGIITYAGLFGKNNETHGTESFTDSIPQIILHNLERLNIIPR